MLAPEPSSTVSNRPEPPQESTADDLQGFAELFRSWDDLPEDQKGSIPRARFDGHVVVRVHVPLGCAAADPRKRPMRGYLWGPFVQQCIDGKGRAHSLRTIDENAVLETTQWLPRPTESAIMPAIRIAISDESTQIWLAPPLVPPCELTIVDTHWLALPKRRVVVSLAGGDDHCATMSR